MQSACVNKKNLKSFMFNISTKTGDSGKTGLVNGQRLNKHHPIFEAVGTLDELNSWIGLLLVKLSENSQLQPLLKKHLNLLSSFQEDLFIIGAQLARSNKVKVSKSLLNKIEKLSETTQKKMDKNWHQKFLMPGGTEFGAYLDISRTVCRRAERAIVALNVIEPVDTLILQIINRFSDYLYLLRCFINWQLKYAEKEFQS